MSFITIVYTILFDFLQDGFVAHFSESSQSQTMWKSLFTVGSICAAGLTLLALNKWKYYQLFLRACLLLHSRCICIGAKFMDLKPFVYPLLGP